MDNEAIQDVNISTLPIQNCHPYAVLDSPLLSYKEKPPRLQFVWLQSVNADELLTSAMKFMNYFVNIHNISVLWIEAAE